MDMAETIELANCECCGLKEDCTHDYIAKVKNSFHGKWLCGLCSEAVRDELIKNNNNNNNNGNNHNHLHLGLHEALLSHMSFCRQHKLLSPAVQVADGMKQLLRRHSGKNIDKKYTRSAANSSVLLVN
ncbi:uncharacterized protein LOC127266579 [Andrographis paniculata]|uniref:uncharacterized protein LOC127266579 n=1 Tax=Andrographis paniculata TaxID=175694 RepID=UPI0021E91D4F|nr:uncharacterized protein LOC127266579 [Andrographis paniculata]